MKSTLRFKANPELCLKILKENTQIGVGSNFLSMMNSKSFYGKFNDDNSFSLNYTTNFRGSFGFKIRGNFSVIDEDIYKTKVQVETEVNKLIYIPLIIFGIVIFYALGGVFLLPFIFFVFILKYQTEKNEKKAINRIIEILEFSK